MNAETPPRIGARDDDDEVDDAGLEATLIERATAGDRSAWGRLYQNHFDGVFRRLAYLTRDVDLAEDLVQETFAVALDSLPSFAGRSAFSTWLHGIGTNVARRHWRKTERGRRARSKVRAALEPESRGVRRDDPESEHLTRQRALVLSALVDQLPTHLREAYILVDLHGLPIPEIAEQLGLTKSNVSVRAHRARRKVRARLVELGWIEETTR